MPEVEMPRRKNLSPTTRARKSRLMKAQHKDPKFRAKFIAGLKRYNAKPSMKKMKAALLQEQKKSAGFERKRLAGFRRYLRERRKAEQRKH